MEERKCIFCKKPFDVNDPYFEREKERRESIFGSPRPELPRWACPGCLMKRHFDVKAAGDAHMARLNFGMNERFPWLKKPVKWK